MKTKFDNIVKIKKEIVNKIQKDIQIINNSIANLNKKMLDLKKLYTSFSIPKNGKMFLFKQINTQKNAILQEINELENQINFLNNRKTILLEELKKANIEYEKMKYLQQEEIKNKLKKLKLKEAKEMDEIAVLRLSFFENNRFNS